MKKLLFIVGILGFNYSVFTQTTIADVSGNYEVKYEPTNGLIIDELNLYADGSFDFHEYIRIDDRLTPEENSYAKGTWKIVKNLIHFTSTKSDFDDKYTLDFNNTKARFITKSSRDTSDRDIKTSLRFYESKISWISSRILLKIDL